MTIPVRSFNPKRRLYPPEAIETRQSIIDANLANLRYTGNPEHKRNPGDYGLTPPSSPRPGKTLCDSVSVRGRKEAMELLRTGFARGFFSEQIRGGWPQNVWAVTERGEPLESQHEGNGAYHGYPMPEADPFREIVLSYWRSPEA
ncbi:MAG: hypothetical protein FJW32_01360 [Acidobacteria bacterium]|nr:hypothetical protein [Acidobacteriota bacterium]